VDVLNLMVALWRLIAYIPPVLVNNLLESFSIKEVRILLDHVGSIHDGCVYIYISNHMKPSITNIMLQSLRHQNG